MLSAAQRKARGERAQRLLEDDLFKDVIKHMRDELMAEWEKTKPEEDLRREDIHRSVRLLKKLLTGFATIANDGRIAGADMQFDETRQIGPRRVA